MAAQNTHGGARPGSGRKRKADKYERKINAAEKKIADRLPELVDNLLILASGGYERVKEKWEPAGTVYIGSGEDKFKAFPDKDDDELVLVERSREVADRDRAANVYLLDRIIGKPTTRQELVDEEGETVPFAIVRVPVKADLEQWTQNAQTQSPQANES